MARRDSIDRRSSRTSPEASDRVVERASSRPATSRPTTSRGRSSTPRQDSSVSRANVQSHYVKSDRRPRALAAMSPPPAPIPHHLHHPSPFDRIASIITTPGGIFSALSLLQHGLRMIMIRHPDLSIDISPGGGRRIQLTKLVDIVGTFRGVMSIADMWGILKMAKAHYKARQPGQDKLDRATGWIEVVSLIGFSAFETAEFFSSKEILRNSRHPHRQSRRAKNYMSYCCTLRLIAMVASFVKIAREHRRDKHLDESEPLQQHEKKRRRINRRRKAMISACWAPVWTANSMKRGLPPLANSACIFMANVTKTQGLWKDSVPARLLPPGR